MKLLFLAFLLFSNFTMSKLYKIDDDKGSFSLSLLGSWTYTKDLFGMPHMFVGQTDAPKDSLSITPAGFLDEKAEAKYLEKTYDIYQDGRRKWAKKRNIKILNFHPFKSKKYQNGNEVRIFGFNYKNGHNEFSDSTFFYHCKDKRMYHLQSLVLSKRKKITEKNILNSIDSLNCKN